MIIIDKVYLFNNIIAYNIAICIKKYSCIVWNYIS